LFLADRGYQVTAFDAAPTAIEQDRAKAAERGLSVDFVVADATTLHGIEGGFRTVVDSALLHCLDTAQRQDYLAALRRVCLPGARLHVLCFTDAIAGAFLMPDGLDEASVRRLFTDGWRIERMESRRYTMSLTRAELSKVLPPGGGAVPPALDFLDSVDDQGRLLMPIWQITAQLA
jgi:ubiquinone/menaquinone biosynthesis C-methylase UbiE